MSKTTIADTGGKGFTFTSDDAYLFKEGTHYKLYEKLGSTLVKEKGVDGGSFRVWAPNADSVSVIGDFNGWNFTANPLDVRHDSSGIWEGFIPGLKQGSTYKYHIAAKSHARAVDKCDPFARRAEEPPKSASVLWKTEYDWNDGEWMKSRAKKHTLSAPVSIYEVHLGSWRRVPHEHNRSLTYRELAHELSEYIKDTGFTHVELMPVMEHPFYGSWGYQITGYFAPSSRYGTPEDLMYLIDHLHQSGIGVILDWVPSHFPSDEHGLANFDGTHLYEHEDLRKGFHPEWKSLIFNYGRHEVRAFLISNALFWLDKFHIDALRVDAVASMLYLDYSREEGEWVPNEFGGNENIEAMDFIKRLNTAAYGEFPDVHIIAEESTDWPMVSRPIYTGGLGFGMKWNMGWMHDTLKYFSKDPVYRKYSHDKLTFSLCYAFNENFMLPLSHDEVVHGKGSLLGKMPGDDWQKFANLRALYGYMYGHPGKKLLFMGAELAQTAEWNHDCSLDWHLLDHESHSGVKRWISDLNAFYKREPALYELDFEHDGFEWVDCRNWEDSIISFIRKGKEPGSAVLVVCNFTPVPRYDFLVGVPFGGYWTEELNSDSTAYWGSGLGNLGGLEATEERANEKPFSLKMTLPPLSTVFFKGRAPKGLGK